MRRVKVTGELDAPAEEIRKALSPESIVEHEATYEVEDTSRRGDDWLVTAVAKGRGDRTVLAFEELPNGYRYELVEGGFFEEMTTTVNVHRPAAGTGHELEPDEVETDSVPGDEAESVCVTMCSEFTFGGLLSPIWDRVGESDRKRELEGAMLRLASELGVLNAPAETDEDGDLDRDHE